MPMQHSVRIPAYTNGYNRTNGPRTPEAPADPWGGTIEKCTTLVEVSPRVPAPCCAPGGPAGSPRRSSGSR